MAAAPASEGPQLIVAEGQLGTRTRLAAGANGIVWKLDQYRLPGDPRPLVFKQFQGAALATTLPGLQTVVNKRLQLPPDRREVLDQLAAWPLCAVVGSGNAPVGVLMHLIDDSFFTDFVLPSGSAGRGPREAQHLIFAAEAARRTGVDVPADRDLHSRLLICAHLAYAMMIIHDAGLVYGDVSLRNILYRLHPMPAIMLVDCDAIRVRGSGAVVTQQNSPDWDAPEPGPQSQYSDRYKVALFILRCLTPGRGSSTNRDPAAAASVLDARGRYLMQTALTAPPPDRPTAREWSSYLRDRTGQPPLFERSPVLRPSGRQGRRPTGWTKHPNGLWVPS
ncbi:hypothetical protein GCM10009681_09040 [Luedemannella helvata]|uniref:Protein kinase domain-containing protein n=2 Tax=Luedemannella helvata TaxID=349315 RepID=A0ABN2JVJ5_9ACTN